MIDVQQWSDQRTASLVQRTHGRLVDEVAFHRVDSGSACGGLRVYEGAARVIDSRLTLDDVGIDSVMVHAFAPSTTTSPHLLSDLACMPDGRWHFHVDLLPRVDLMTHPDYLDGVYPPLEQHFLAATGLPGSEPMAVPRRLRALGSAWLVGVVAAASDEPVLTDTHDHYAQRFLDLLDDPPEPVDPDQQIARDRAHRRSLFDEATDPVWDVLNGIIGKVSVDGILEAIRAPWR
jgi:hypothetical protein